MYTLKRVPKRSEGQKNGDKLVNHGQRRLHGIGSKFIVLGAAYSVVPEPPAGFVFTLSADVGQWLGIRSAAGCRSKTENRQHEQLARDAHTPR